MTGIDDGDPVKRSSSLKRTTPLESRTPLKSGKNLERRTPLRSGGGLARSGLKRGNPLKGRKSKRATRDDRTFKAGWSGNETCVWPVDGGVCGQRAVAHHVHGRAVRPDLRGDPTNRLPLCPTHNTAIESDATLAEQARTLGVKGTSSYEHANPYPWSKLQRQAEQM